MIWVCLFFSLSHTLLYTHSHTHTCLQTHTSLSSPPVCHFNQRSRCFAVPPVLTHLISPSIYSGCARGSLPDYCISCIVCVLLFFIVLRPCLVSPGDAESFWCFLSVLLPLPVSPVPRSLPRLISLGSLSSSFVLYFLSSASTHDRLPCFLLLH